MACGICCFASFCSLRDVLKIYDLSSGFLDEIYDRIRPGQWVGSPN